MESFRLTGQHHSQSVPKISPSQTRIVRCKKIVNFNQDGDTLNKKVMEDLSSEERRSVVEESSSMVLSLLKREGVGAHCQALSERVWLSQALKRGQAQPTGGVRKRMRSPSYRWLSGTSKDISRLTRSVAEHYAREWKREWGGEDTIGFNMEISCIHALRERRSS